MNKIITIILIFLTSFSFAQSYVIDYNNVSKRNKEMLKELLLKKKDNSYYDINDNNFWVFLYDLAVIESNGVWVAKNGDHIGLWQMGKMARKDAIDISKHKFNHQINEFESKEFVKNPFIFTPEKQKIHICYYMINIQEVMSKYINQYENTFINGVYITKSGIVGASHLVGVGSVKEYFDSNGEKIKKDGNDTSLEKYLILFWDYNF